MSIANKITKALMISILLVGKANAEEKQFEYVVIGAGAAGLSAAHTLKNMDKDFVVLEKKKRPGGIANSGRKGRFHYAKGTEYLGAPEGQLAKVISELDIPMVEIPSPMDVSFFQGKMYAGDKQIAALTVEQSGKDEFQKFIDLLHSAENMTRKELFKLDKITAKQWLDENKIAPFIQQRYNVMSRGLFGANLNDISALSFIPEAGFDYIGVKEVSDLMESSAHSESWTTQTGIATIATSIATNIGQHIRYDSTVEKIKKKGNGYKIEYLTAGERQSINAKKIIVATPAPITAYIAKEVLTPEQLKILSQVEYAQYITVALFSDTPIFNKAFDMAILDGDVITDLYDATWVERHYNPELRNIKEFIASAYLAPKGVSDKSLLNNSDKEIMDIVYKELSRVSPDIKKKITGYDITRFYYAYPVFNEGYYARLLKLKSSFKDIFLAGDYMSYPTFEAAFESGHEAVIQAEKE